MGAVINDHELPARIVASSANNQLAKELSSRGILYAPDYVINAGGMIKIAHGPDFDKNHDETRIYDHLDQIHDTLSEVFQRADSENTATNFVADAMSEERFQTAL
jgi:leucine dehydrogenase